MRGVRGDDRDVARKELEALRRNSVVAVTLRAAVEIHGVTAKTARQHTADFHVVVCDAVKNGVWRREMPDGLQIGRVAENIQLETVLAADVEQNVQGMVGRGKADVADFVAPVRWGVVIVNQQWQNEVPRVCLDRRDARGNGPSFVGKSRGDAR